MGAVPNEPVEPCDREDGDFQDFREPLSILGDILSDAMLKGCDHELAQHCLSWLHDALCDARDDHYELPEAPKPGSN